MLYQVMPRPRPKYFGLGPAWIAVFGARKRKGGASAAIGEYVAMKKPAEQNESGEVSKKLVTAFVSYYVLHIFWLLIFSSRCVRILCVDWLS